MHRNRSLNYLLFFKIFYLVVHSLFIHFWYYAFLLRCQISLLLFRLIYTMNTITITTTSDNTNASTTMIVNNNNGDFPLIFFACLKISSLLLFF